RLLTGNGGAHAHLRLGTRRGLADRVLRHLHLTRLSVRLTGLGVRLAGLGVLARLLSNAGAVSLRFVEVLRGRLSLEWLLRVLLLELLLSWGLRRRPTELRGRLLSVRGLRLLGGRLLVETGSRRLPVRARCLPELLRGRLLGLRLLIETR